MDALFKVISSVWISVDDLAAEIVSDTKELRNTCSNPDELDVRNFPVLNEKVIRLNELVNKMNNLLNEISLKME